MTFVLGLAEFRVRECREIDGEVELTVETRAGVVGCHGCGVRTRSKGRSTVLVRDIDAFDRPVRLRWVKRRWQCIEPACAVKTWTEQTAAIGSRRQQTERARAQACRRVGRDGESVAAVASDFAVGWHTIMRAVVDVGAQPADAIQRVVLGAAVPEGLLLHAAADLVDDLVAEWPPATATTRCGTPTASRSNSKRSTAPRRSRRPRRARRVLRHRPRR